MTFSGYLMESAEENLRLDLKTDEERLKKQVRWAGVEAGMRVADIGCGSGKTTFFMQQLVAPEGESLGLDISKPRIAFAREHYSAPGLQFVCRDVFDPLDDLGSFDFVWSRFLLEYHRVRCGEIVEKLATLVKPGGILCLADLDYNCLTHYGFPERLVLAIQGLIGTVERRAGFDPYVGRKLYAYMYDLGFEDIEVTMIPHHLIFGDLNEVDSFNWTQKLLVAGKRVGYAFPEYNGDFEAFREEFLRCFADPRRFTYTPLICCRGRRPFPGNASAPCG